MTLNEARTLVAGVSRWHHSFEIYQGLVTPGAYDPVFLLDKMRLPADLRGLRVLDIGTSDGFFALQLARRGADVVAIDYRGKRDHGYYVMERLNPVQIEYHQMNVYQLADKHHQLEDRLHELTVKPYLSEPEQVEEVTLKKQKLQLKDRMENILRRHRQDHAHG